VGAKTQAELRQDASTRGLPLLATARARAGRSVGDKGLGAFARLIDQLADLASEVELPELIHAVIDRSGY
jgi:hypothetical protein